MLNPNRYMGPFMCLHYSAQIWICDDFDAVNIILQWSIKSVTLDILKPTATVDCGYMELQI